MKARGTIRRGEPDQVLRKKPWNSKKKKKYIRKIFFEKEDSFFIQTVNDRGWMPIPDASGSVTSGCHMRRNVQ